MILKLAVRFLLVVHRTFLFDIQLNHCIKRPRDQVSALIGFRQNVRLNRNVSYIQMAHEIK